MRYSSFQSRRGFTLIELLLVIGIIAILASIVIVAINPTKQLGDARDAQRRSDVNTLINAVYQYAIDNNGNLPSGLTTPLATKFICGTANGTLPSSNCVDLATPLAISGSYLVGIPHDPQTATGYTVSVASNSRITVAAPGTEQAATDISVTR